MYIALCGAPGSGKSTVQQVLLEEFDIQPVDDGRVLRDIAIRSFGLTEEEVSTTKGKNSYVEIMGDNWQVRKVLGEIGRSLENVFNEHIVPHLTILNQCTDPNKNYSFGSVRRTQPQYFNKIGGLVVEIVKDGCISVYDFDHYYGKIDMIIINNGTRDELREQIVQKFQGTLG